MIGLRVCCGRRIGLYNCAMVGGLDGCSVSLGLEGSAVI